MKPVRMFRRCQFCHQRLSVRRWLRLRLAPRELKWTGRTCAGKSIEHSARWHCAECARRLHDVVPSGRAGERARDRAA